MSHLLPDVRLILIFSNSHNSWEGKNEKWWSNYCTIIPMFNILTWCRECALTKEGVRGSISIFVFRLLLPRLLRLLANVDGQPRAHHPANSARREKRRHALHYGCTGALTYCTMGSDWQETHRPFSALKSLIPSAGPQIWMTSSLVSFNRSAPGTRKQDLAEERNPLSSTTALTRPMSTEPPALQNVKQVHRICNTVGFMYIYLWINSRRCSEGLVDDVIIRVFSLLSSSYEMIIKGSFNKALQKVRPKELCISPCACFTSCSCGSREDITELCQVATEIWKGPLLDLLVCIEKRRYLRSWWRAGSRGRSGFLKATVVRLVVLLWVTNSEEE